MRGPRWLVPVLLVVCIPLGVLGGVAFDGDSKGNTPTSIGDLSPEDQATFDRLSRAQAYGHSLGMELAPVVIGNASNLTIGDEYMNYVHDLCVSSLSAQQASERFGWDSHEQSMAVVGCEVGVADGRMALGA